MPEKHEHIIHKTHVFALSAKGKSELQGARTSLSPSELEVLVLIDGKSTVGETAARAQSLGIGAVMDILGRLFLGELIEFAKDQDRPPDAVDFFAGTGPITLSAATKSKAEKQAAATAALLKERGYSVRIARRVKSIGSLEETRVLSVLVIEDEPRASKLLKSLLTADGFEVRTARNCGEIVAEFDKSPYPDLVLLDVVLPDATGFDVLRLIREHPTLRAIPVVMLTVQATREAVLKGLICGADGIITKPFRIGVLEKAIASVLGLAGSEVDIPETEDLWDL